MKDLRAAHHVFLSYAREDLALARRLAAAMEASGRTVAMDVTDIAPGDDWQAQLDRLLSGAAKLVFLATPASVGSLACQQELSAALSAGKPVLLVMTGQMKSTDLPAAVRHLHYIRLAGEDPGTILPALVAAIDLDLEWERRKAALLTRATEKGALLHSRAELRSAETWAMFRPDGAAPVPETILNLIARSRAWRNRRGFGLFAGAGIAVVTMAALAGYSWWQSERARAALTESQRRAAQQNVEPALRLSRDGWTFEALDQLRGILAVFPRDGLPAAILAPAEEIIRRAESETAIPVPAGAKVFPGRDGAWILEKYKAGWRLSLLHPDGNMIRSEINAGPTMLAVADYPDGPRAILANETSQRFEMEPKFRMIGAPEPLPETEISRFCWQSEHTELFPVACMGDLEVNAFLNRRGEYTQLVASEVAEQRFGQAVCLADDGAFASLIALGARRLGYKGRYPVGCRLYPDQSIVVTAGREPSDPPGLRSNFDHLYVGRPDNPGQFACLALGSWQDVEVSLSSQPVSPGQVSVDLVLTDLTEIRQWTESLEYQEMGAGEVNCPELSDGSDKPALRMPAAPAFTRSFSIDPQPAGGGARVLMAYMPDRNEIRLIRIPARDEQLRDHPEPDFTAGEARLIAQAQRDRTICWSMFREIDADPELRLGTRTFITESDTSLPDSQRPPAAPGETEVVNLLPALSGFEFDFCLALSPDGDRLAAFADGRLHLFRISAGSLQPIWSQETRMIGTAIFPDDDRLVTGNANSLQLWTAREGGDLQPRTLLTSPVAVSGLSLSPSGQRLAALLGDAGSPDALVVMDLSDGSVIARQSGEIFRRPRLRVAFAGENRLYIRNDSDGSSLMVALPYESDLRLRAAVLP